MVVITVDYEGELHCKAVHGPSKIELVTDAPADNCGRGEAFSPTDLAATALGTCILTTMAIAARNRDVDLAGSSARVEKEMTADAPRRIARLGVRVEIPLPPDHPERKVLEAAGMGCPVHRSLHPDVVKDVTFSWKG